MIDYIGEVHPNSLRGMAYIVVATEYLTKWAETKAVKTNTAAHAATFMYENIIVRFGCPKILVSDRDIHFLNELIQEMTDRFQIDHRKTTPYHHQTNGQTERVNGTLVNILRKTITDAKRDWDVNLTVTLWAYRTTFNVITHTRHEDDLITSQTFWKSIPDGRQLYEPKFMSTYWVMI